MKRRLLPSTCLFIFAIIHPLSAQIFVKHGATGANNGTSWTNAYTNLKTALSAATAGSQIWVAAGTYKPDVMNGSPASTFLIDKNLQLLGGFNGTETSANQRNPVLNETILSGDLNGNDIDGNFTQNRADNVLHVAQVNANVTSETLVDGFTIEGGQADGGGSLSDGGGMHCSGKPVVRQCIFRQNAAFEGGGGVRLNSVASPGPVFENCQFNSNQANFGGGMSINNSSYFTLTGCSFSGNATVTGPYQANGGGIWCSNGNGVLQDCSFSDNSAHEYCGAMGAWTPPAFTDGNSIELRGCHFGNNTAVGAIGGLFLSVSGNNPVFKVSDCEFTGITSNGASALDISMSGTNTILELTNSVFKNNTSTAGFATAAVYSSDGGTGTVLVDSCVFQDNNAVYSAGLDIGGGGDFDFTITNCDFLQNHADTTNAGFDIWADVGSKLNFTIENCLLDGNTAGKRAAGFWVIPASDDFHATMKNCRIVNNQSPKGAAIDIFREAVSGFPALVNASFTVENCLIANNSSDGGVVTLDTLRHFNLVNCTIADNTGGGILNGNLGGLTLQNTILHNPGFTEYSASANSTFTSHGGNLVGDGSMNGLLGIYDQQNENPLFTGGAAPFQLSLGSPAIDKGILPDNAPATDLEGNPRVVGCIDIGAFESPFITSFECLTSSGEVLAENKSLVLVPNPATDFLNVELPETTFVPLDVQVFDAQGRLLRRQQLATGQALDVQGLSAGMYW